MPLFESSNFQIELPQDGSAFVVIPSIGQQNAANIPKNCADLDHCLRLRLLRKVERTTNAQVDSPEYLQSSVPIESPDNTEFHYLQSPESLRVIPTEPRGTSGFCGYRVGESVTTARICLPQPRAVRAPTTAWLAW